MTTTRTAARPRRTNDVPQNAINELTVPPQNLQTERGVLGGELLDSGQIEAVRAIIKPEDFYSDIHATVQRVLNDMRDSNAPVDVETLAHALESRGELADIGGPPYLIELLNAVPHTAHTETYAKQVKELARRRAAVNLGRDLMANAHDKAQATDDVLNAAETKLHGLIEGGIVGGPKSIGDILLTVLANPEQADEGIPTGFDEIDHLTGGLRPGAVVVIAARPSMGKTALACGVMLNVARNGSGVLIATYEQPAKEIAQRLLSSRAGTPWESLRSSPNTLHDVSNDVSGWPIQIDDSGHDIGKLVATIRLAARKGTQVVIVDYLQLVPPEDASVIREQQVASSSRKLKQVAMACNVCVIVLSQLNRQVENRPDARPRLSDLVNRERSNKPPIRRGCSGGRTRDRPTNPTPWPASTSPKTATARPASSTSNGTARPARFTTKSLPPLNGDENRRRFTAPAR